MGSVWSFIKDIANRGSEDIGRTILFVIVSVILSTKNMCVMFGINIYPEICKSILNSLVLWLILFYYVNKDCKDSLKTSAIMAASALVAAPIIRFIINKILEKLPPNPAKIIFNILLNSPIYGIVVGVLLGTTLSVGRLTCDKKDT